MKQTVLLPILLLMSLITSKHFCNSYKRADYDPSEEKEIPVKIKLLGDLATPHPDSDIELGFIPKQVYYQVRRYDTKKRLPQSEALKEASTPEEVINAPRLREVLTHKKTQEVNISSVPYLVCNLGYDVGKSIGYCRWAVANCAGYQLCFSKTCT